MFVTVLWNYIVAVSPYLLFGFFVAALVHNFLSLSVIKKQLGDNSIGSIFKAALFGVPLPLCSCSVLPSAVILRKAGVSNGATSAFLISTPETGVDSILVTYGMMGLPMAIIRPVVSFITASIAGLFQHFFNTFQYIEKDIPKDSGCSKNQVCGCGHKKESAPLKVSFIKSFFKTIHYATGPLLQDIALWLTIGLLLGALIEFAVPADFFTNISGPFGRLIILLIGIPFYICASASTPIAVSMIVKGMSPGTALILLLVGPATNISTFLVIKKYIGAKGVLINILVLAVVSYLVSFVIDFMFGYFAWSLPTTIGMHHDDHFSLLGQICGVIFSILLLYALWTSEIKPRVRKIIGKK